MSGASARQAARADRLLLDGFDAGHYSLPTELLDLRAALERLAAARSCSGCNSQAALLEEQPISRWPGTASGCPSEKASAERQDSHPETESQRGNQQREERRNPGDAHEQPAEHTPHEKQEDNGVPRRHKARKQVEEPDAKLQKAGQSGQRLSRGRSERGTETGNDHKSPFWRRTKGTPALVAQTAEGPQSLGVRLLQDIASAPKNLRRPQTDPRPIRPPLSPGPEKIALGPVADGQ